MLRGLLSAWAMVSLTRILRGSPLGVERRTGMSVLIAPNASALFDPDHLIPPASSELRLRVFQV